jgi:tripartite-type tricarboxylate transporter receptor subunit TctC
VGGTCRVSARTPASRKETPAEIMGRLNREINACLVNPEIKAQLIGLGATALVLSPGDFGKLMAADIEKWGKVIRVANLRAE